MDDEEILEQMLRDIDRGRRVLDAPRGRPLTPRETARLEKANARLKGVMRFLEAYDDELILSQEIIFD